MNNDTTFFPVGDSALLAVKALGRLAIRQHEEAGRFEAAAAIRRQLEDLEKVLRDGDDGEVLN